MSDDVLTLEEAVSRLPHGDTIHTFVNPGVGMLIGADWSREQVLNAFKKHGPRLAGEHATNMKHGLCFHDGERWVFVESVNEESK